MPSARRPDASMDLLNEIVRQPVDPDYAVTAARGIQPARGRWDFAVVAVLIGALFALAILQTSRSAPVEAAERRNLIDRIQQAEAEQDQLQQRLAALDADLDQLRSAALADDDSAAELERSIDRLGPTAGATPVTGPGIVIVVDDAASATDDARDRVLDLDLQIIANGLWAAGAEAVAVNGHRLSARTAIRGAGDAITVDYRSLTRPYRIEAIGDPRTLPARWVESSGGAWWQELAHNRGMRYEVSSVDELALDADPGLSLRYATRAPS